MMSDPRNRLRIEIGKVCNDAEAKSFTRLVSHALFYTGVDMDAWLQREGVEHARVARIDGKIVGGLTVQPLGQWFGGKVVAMGGVRSVAVAPEYRAAGVASTLMRSVLREMRDNNQPIATLYPATQEVYRRAGFEKAGVRRRYRVRTHMIDLRDRTLDVRPIEDADRETLEGLHRERARRTAGNLERSRWVWDRILDPPPWMKPTSGYLVSRNGTAEGYLVNHNTPGQIPHDNTIELQDFVATTPGAARRLWTLLADHRSMAGSVIWNGAPADPLMYALDENMFQIEDPIDWMVRINDVPTALESRGYPACLNATLHLDVRDDVIPENNGRFIVTVAGGIATVESGGRGDLSIDVRGLAPLYTGHLSARELLVTGYIDTKQPPSNEVLDTAALIFAGPAPWMSDMF